MVDPDRRRQQPAVASHEGHRIAVREAYVEDARVASVQDAEAVALATNPQRGAHDAVRERGVAEVPHHHVGSHPEAVRERQGPTEPLVLQQERDVVPAPGQPELLDVVAFDDQEAAHALVRLGRGQPVGVRVVPVGARAVHDPELVGVRGPGPDLESGVSVGRLRHGQAVPVQDRGLGQAVHQVDAGRLALPHPDRGRGDAAVQREGAHGARTDVGARRARGERQALPAHLAHGVERVPSRLLEGLGERAQAAGEREPGPRADEADESPSVHGSSLPGCAVARDTGRRTVVPMMDGYDRAGTGATAVGASDRPGVGDLPTRPPRPRGPRTRSR